MKKKFTFTTKVSLWANRHIKLNDVVKLNNFAILFALLSLHIILCLYFFRSLQWLFILNIMTSTLIFLWYVAELLFLTRSMSEGYVDVKKYTTARDLESVVTNFWVSIFFLYPSCYSGDFLISWWLGDKKFWIVFL